MYTTVAASSLPYNPQICVWLADDFIERLHLLQTAARVLADAGKLRLANARIQLFHINLHELEAGAGKLIDIEPRSNFSSYNY